MSYNFEHLNANTIALGGEEMMPVTAIVMTLDDKTFITGMGSGLIKFWYLRKRTCYFTMQAHSSEIIALLLTSDNKRLISLDQSGILKVWEYESKKLLYECKCSNTRAIAYDYHLIPTSCATPILLTSDDKYLIQGENDIQIRDLNNQAKLVCTLTVKEKSYNPENIISLTMSSNNLKLIAGMTNGSIQTWDFPQRKCLKAIEFAHSKYVSTLTVTKDSEMLISGSYFDCYVKLWNLNTFECAYTFCNKGPATSLILTNDERYIIALLGDKLFQSGFIDILDINQKKKERTIKEIDGPEVMVASKNQNYILVGSRAKSTLTIFEFETGLKLAQIENPHSSTVLCISTSHDGKYAITACKNPCVIKIWDLQNNIHLHTVTHASGCSAITNLCVSYDNKYFFSIEESFGLFSSRQLCEVNIYDLNRRILLHSYTYLHDVATAITITRDNKYLIVNLKSLTFRETKMKVYSIESRKCLSTFNTPHSLEISRVINTYDKAYLITINVEGPIKIWNLKTKSKLKTIMENGFITMALTQDNKKLVASTSNGNIDIWDFKTLKKIGKIADAHQSMVTSLEVSSDGQLIISAAKAQNRIRFWSFKTGKLLFNWENAHSQGVTALALMPKNNCLLSGSQSGCIKISYLMEKQKESNEIITKEAQSMEFWKKKSHGFEEEKDFWKNKFFELEKQSAEKDAIIAKLSARKEKIERNQDDISPEENVIRRIDFNLKSDKNGEDRERENLEETEGDSTQNKKIRAD